MPQQFTNGYALLIGVNENAVSGWALPDVANDIEALAEVLRHPERCAYPPANVKTITGKAATRQGILDGLDWLHQSIEADESGNATAVLYYTGHGWVDTTTEPNAFYFIPFDVKENNISSRALRATDFAGEVAALAPQRLLVMLDCCHAGGMGVKDVVSLPAGYKETAVSPSLLMKGEKAISPGSKSLEGLAQGRGRAVLSSSTGEQRSYIRRDRKMSIFTYHLIEALTGNAQPQAGAVEVLVSDVLGHVTRNVPRSAKTDWHKEQTPDNQLSGNFPVALLLGGKGLGSNQSPPDPLEPAPSPQPAQAAHRIDTGGGAYIGGSVSTGGGDFVGRDKIVHGDEVRGDKVTGGKAGRDIYHVSHVSGTGVAIEPGAQATASQAGGSQDLVKLFAEIYQEIEDRPEDPNVDKEELVGTVEKIQKEVAKGEQANSTWVERRLKTLALMAPDIFEVTVVCLTHPLAGIATVIRNVAEKARAEESKT